MTLYLILMSCLVAAPKPTIQFGPGSYPNSGSMLSEGTINAVLHQGEVSGSCISEPSFTTDRAKAEKALEDGARAFSIESVGWKFEAGIKTDVQIKELHRAATYHIDESAVEVGK